MARVLVASAAMKGTLSAVEMAECITATLKQHLGHQFPELEIQAMPIADGGTDTLKVLEQMDAGLSSFIAEVTGPLPGQIVRSQYLLDHQHRHGVIEAAQAHGIHYLTEETLSPLNTTSYGVGELIEHALEQILGAPNPPTLDRPYRMLIALGGSASTDGGAGALQALGFKLRRQDGSLIEEQVGGGSLHQIVSIELPDPESRVMQAMGLVHYQIATDVFSPLLGEQGAAIVFAPQKGADFQQVETLEKGLTHWSTVVSRDLGLDRTQSPGSGAAGGLGFGLSCLPEARTISGAHWMANLLNIPEIIEQSDIVITAEGKLDQTSFAGKLTGEVIRLATHRPVLVICGQHDPSVTLPSNNRVVPLVSDTVDEHEACVHPKQHIEAALVREIPYLQSILEQVGSPVP